VRDYEADSHVECRQIVARIKLLAELAKQRGVPGSTGGRPRQDSD
jgi:hypothetical protein